ncbi:class I SAM-dependent methyltransferase [Zhongshania sp.]|jgi:ubiquinone/menaquinone biosynthesis C-methylase UbiE|uniref:class I SAM-dependent methyltransferase n=1 Tax=Zhongshania sp. TaxID=1971902 RepID=UPI001B744EBB|nr:class I SAM-dependent methyltransferase [Zhongshania sp.]MBQ0796472.1 class I SAM-dependent methyltransferase [Zhongshania sp.]
MGFYDNKILPVIIDKACSMSAIMTLREKVVPLASGVVLEVGMGSGINLALYKPDIVDFVWGLEPSVGMRKKAQRNLDNSPVEVKWLDLPGEAIPLEDESVDTVLLTYTLCTIPDWQAALAQMHRVLKPSGKLLFCEHGLADSHAVQHWQNKITPMWKKLAGGCHLNRPISESIASCGFTINKLDTCYADGVPKIAGYMYYGEAVKS